MLLDTVAEAIQMTERALAIERTYGIKPGDGSVAGKLMAEQEIWIKHQKEKISNAQSDLHSYYSTNINSKN